MTIHDWYLLALACFIGAASPGPSLALLTRAVLKGGRSAGVIFACTHGLGIMLYAGLVVFGLAGLLKIAPQITLALQILGVLFLLYVSQAMLRNGLALRKQALRQHPSPPSPPSPSQATDKTSKQKPAPLQHAPLQHAPLQHALDGFLIVFLNPKVAAFFLAIFSQFLKADLTPLTRTAMITTAWAIDTGWYILIAFIASWPAVLAHLKRHHGTLEISMGALLFLAALAIFSIN